MDLTEARAIIDRHLENAFAEVLSNLSGDIEPHASQDLEEIADRLAKMALRMHWLNSPEEI